MSPADGNSKSAIAQTLFAAWLAENQPDLFNELARRSGNATAQPLQLSGFTDFLSSIGSSISGTAKSLVSSLSSTVKSVGSFLGTKEGAATLTAVASTYATLKIGDAQAQALRTQADRAAAGEVPAPIQMQWDPSTQSYVPVNPQGYAMSAGQVAQYGPNFFNQYAPYILGGAALLAVLLLRK